MSRKEMLLELFQRFQLMHVSGQNSDAINSLVEGILLLIEIEIARTEDQ